jgi:serine/threonine-protein kinase RsbW
MYEFDMTQTSGIALQLATDLREDFVAYTYFLSNDFVAYTYSLSSDVAMVSPFVDHLMRLINGLRVTDGTEVDIEVALREALLNAIIHGNREDPSKHVYLTILCDANGEVSTVIRDEGDGFESSSIPDPTAPEHRMSTHGRGIYLMRALMDEVSFEEGGTVVYMRKGRSSHPYRSQ